MFKTLYTKKCVTADSLVCIDCNMPVRPSASLEACAGSVPSAPVQLVAIEPIDSDLSELEAEHGIAELNIFSSHHEHVSFMKRHGAS